MHLIFTDWDAGTPSLSQCPQMHLIFTDWDVGKPVLLAFIQFTFETFCGGVVLNQFAHSVFQMAVQSLSPINCTQILAGLQVNRYRYRYGYG